ncbi:hypothetical protein GCM10023083_68040 [Streptomyces phyllanthi]
MPCPYDDAPEGTELRLGIARTGYGARAAPQQERKASRPHMNRRAKPGTARRVDRGWGGFQGRGELRKQPPTTGAVGWRVGRVSGARGTAQKTTHDRRGGTAGAERFRGAGNCAKTTHDPH